MKLTAVTLPCALAVALTLASPPTWAADAGAAGIAYQRSYERERARDYRGALAALDQVPTAQQASYVFHLRRGWLRYLAGDHGDAVTSYRQAAALAPAAIEPLLGMMLPQMAQRRWRDSLATGRRALRKDPRSYLARTRVAWSLYNLGRYEKSRALYAQVLRDYPSKADLRDGLGWCLLKLGRTQEAITAFREVLGIAPRHRTARRGAEMLGAAP